jgi:hypothetical protein
MKLIIAGSRTITKYSQLENALKCNSGIQCNHITEIVSGHARGADRLGEKFAKIHGYPLKIFRARWDSYGPVAGFIRNEEMADYGDVLLALWDGESTGTDHIITMMDMLNKPYYVHYVR